MNDVTLEMPNGQRIIFPCNKWLAKDEDDGKLERDLYPLKENKEKYNRAHLHIGSEINLIFFSKWCLKKYFTVERGPRLPCLC